MSRIIKFGNKDINYIEFIKENSSDKTLIKAVDEVGHLSQFTMSDEELHVLYRFLIGENENE